MSTESIQKAISAATEAYFRLKSTRLDFADLAAQAQTVLLKEIDADPEFPMREPERFRAVRATIEYLRITAEFQRNFVATAVAASASGKGTKQNADQTQNEVQGKTLLIEDTGSEAGTGDEAAEEDKPSGGGGKNRYVRDEAGKLTLARKRP